MINGLKSMPKIIIVLIPHILAFSLSGVIEGFDSKIPEVVIYFIKTFLLLFTGISCNYNF